MSQKCVIVVDDSLPVGLKANIAAVLCLSVGANFPDVVGPDATDGTGNTYAGITQIPVPVLMSSTSQLADLVGAARDKDLYHASFTDAALNTKKYDDYTAELAAKRSDEVVHHGVVLVASDKQVKKLTSGLPLLK
jgi:hypothetical protein